MTKEEQYKIALTNLEQAATTYAMTSLKHGCGNEELALLIPALAEARKLLGKGDYAIKENKNENIL